MARNSFEVVLQETRILSPSTRDFRFVRSDGKPVEFEPGQFFRFVFTDDRGEFERSYSLCNYGEAIGTDRLDLVVSTVDGGRASALLFNCKPGLRARVTGPFGRLLVPDPLPQRLFLVATSVGIAPYIPMLTRLAPALAAGEVEVHFLYGTRDASEFVYGDLLTSYAEAHAAFHLSVCYSRQDTGASNLANVSFHEGYVQARLVALAPDPATDRVLLCGNPNMIDAAWGDLRAAGFGVKQVIREKYVFARDPEPGANSTKAMTAEQKQLLLEKMKKYQS